MARRAQQALRRITAGCGLVLALAGPCAGADTLDAAKALQRCERHVDDREGRYNTDRVEAYQSGWCLGYTSGIMDMLGSARERAWACPPQSVDELQVIRMVVKFWKDNPARHHEHPMWAYIETLRAAFPCPQRLAPEPF